MRPRDAWIRWSHALLPARRHLLAKNARFCILADPHQLSNLASRALGLCCARHLTDWLARWAYPIVAVESFVDGHRFRGTAYKAAGWTRVTHGQGRDSTTTHETESYRIKPHELRKLRKHQCIVVHCERGYRKTTLPPLESDGAVARWYRGWWFTR